jgi:hypothetical protein
MEDIVIVSAARTAVGKFGGSLAKTSATELGAIVIKEAAARAKAPGCRPGGRSHHGPGAGRRRRPEPGAPGA